jgi:hypothetical protein
MPEFEITDSDRPDYIKSRKNNVWFTKYDNFLQLTLKADF